MVRLERGRVCVPGVYTILVPGEWWWWWWQDTCQGQVSRPLAAISQVRKTNFQQDCRVFQGELQPLSAPRSSLPTSLHFSPLPFQLASSQHPPLPNPSLPFLTSARLFSPFPSPSRPFPSPSRPFPLTVSRNWFGLRRVSYSGKFKAMLELFSLEQN